MLHPTAQVPYRPRRGRRRDDGRRGTALLYQGLPVRRLLVRFDDGAWQWVAAREWETLPRPRPSEPTPSPRF